MTTIPRPNMARRPIPSVINPVGRRSFCITIPEHPEHYAAFWGAMLSLTHPSNWEQEETHKAAEIAAVWRELYDFNQGTFDLRENCIIPTTCDEGECTDYPPRSPFITYAPNDPFRTPEFIPSPYPIPPWYTNPGIPLPGVLPDDAMVNGLAIIAFGDIIGLVEVGLPRARIRFTGSGMVELEFVLVPQGGWAYVILDLDIATAKLVDLATLTILGHDFIEDLFDGFVGGVTDNTFILEIPVDFAGDHIIDIGFAPQVGSDILLGFGGGLRRIALCGVDIVGEVTEDTLPQFRVVDCILQSRPNDAAAWSDLVDLTECTVPGATGPQGDTGATGPQGDTGATGDAGRDGRDGIAAEWCEVVDFRSESTATIVIGEWANTQGYIGTLDGDDTTLELLINFARPITITDLKLPFAVFQETVIEMDFGYEDDLGVGDDREEQAGVWEIADDEVIRWQGAETGVSFLRIRANSPNVDAGIQMQGLSYCGKNPHVALFAPIPATHDCIETQTFEVSPDGELNFFPSYRVNIGTWSVGDEAINGDAFDTDNLGRKIDVDIPLWCPTQTVFLHVRGTYPQPDPHFVTIQGLAYDEFGNILDTYYEAGLPLNIGGGVFGITFTVGNLIPAYVNIVVEFSASDAGGDLGQRFLDLLDVYFV